jgi:hypothetical protein
VVATVIAQSCGGGRSVADLPEHLSGTLPVRVPGELPPPVRPHRPPEQRVMERVRDGLRRLPDAAE